MRPLCGGQLYATVIPSSIIFAGAAQQHWSWLSQSATAFLPGEPWKNTHMHPTEHIQRKPARHLVGVTPHSGCPGIPISGANLPLAPPVPQTMAICPNFQGEGSLLHRTAPGRLLTARNSKTNGQISLTPRPGKITGRKGVVCTFFSGWGIWCQLLQLFDAVAQIFCFINPEPGHLSPVEQVSRISSIETQQV